MTRAQAEALWSVERAAEIDWMDEQSRAGWPGPPTRPAPVMTVPPPYSPDWYRRFPA